jgi:hypothetical protein
MADPNTALPAQPPARLVHDGHWHYRGYHGCPSVCHLRVYEPTNPQEPLVVVFTELRDQTGTSVTNRIEHLATQIWRWLERPQRGITVIEHYPPRGVHVATSRGERWQFAEEFDLVEMTRTEDERFEKPHWKPSTRAAIEQMIGQPFPEECPDRKRKPQLTDTFPHPQADRLRVFLCPVVVWASGCGLLGSL